MAFARLQPGLACRRAPDRTGRARPIGWYNFHAAGAWALLGDRTRALASLERLVDGGWDGEAEWLEDYWALQGLTGDAAFKAIVERQRAAETD